MQAKNAVLWRMAIQEPRLGFGLCLKYAHLALLQGRLAVDAFADRFEGVGVINNGEAYIRRQHIRDHARNDREVSRCHYARDLANK